MGLHYTLYMSKAGPQFSDQELFCVLDQARARNMAAEITGMLLYRDRVIAQLLEGPRDRIERVYRKIARDSRHYDVERLEQGPLLQRHFPNWSMGFERVTDAVDELGDSESLFSKPAPWLNGCHGSSSALDALLRFRRLNPVAKVATTAIQSVGPILTA